jgi:hypothetical protein
MIQWPWLIPSRDASRSLLVAAALAVPAAWLFAHWLPWPVTLLFLGAQLPHCSRTDALDDWAYSLVVGGLAFWVVCLRGVSGPLPTVNTPWDVALAAASAPSAAFIGWRPYRRARRPLLGDERD